MASPPRKKYRSNASKVDLSEDDTNYLPFGWEVSYNQRALLVRMVCQERKARSNILSDLQAVKFITKEPNSHEEPGFICKGMNTSQFTNMDKFFAQVERMVKTFEHSDINSEYWEEIVSCIKLFDFKYEEQEDDYWTCINQERFLTAEFKNLPKGKQRYLTAFEMALKSDMLEGCAKNWLSFLFRTLIESTDDIQMEEELSCFAPPFYDNSNTDSEIITGDLDSLDTQLLYNAPYTALPCRNPEGSSLDSASSFEVTPGDNTVKRCIIVPDFYVMHSDFPGMFPLVIEVKPAKESYEGVNQNMKQMLSKLFFQDVVFGIVITPTLYHLSVIVKKHGELHFATVAESLITFEDGVKKLDIGSLNILCTFIYRVLKWSKKTKCLLEAEPMPK